MYNNFIYKNKTAFTLAETLITLTIIGVVAALTVPTLMTKINSHAYKTGSKKMESTLKNAFAIMSRDDSAFQSNSTEEFVANFKSYMKIAKTCDNNNLKDCFPENFKAGDEDYSISEMKNSNGLDKDWEPSSNTNGAILQDGTQMLISYNTNCKTNAPNNISTCVAIAYDLNGKGKKPNSYNGNGISDIGVFNAGFSRTTCEAQLNLSSSIFFSATNFPSSDDPGYQLCMDEINNFCANKATGTVPYIIQNSNGSLSGTCGPS